MNLRAEVARRMFWQTCRCPFDESWVFGRKDHRPTVTWLVTDTPIVCPHDTCHDGWIDTQRGDDTEHCGYCDGKGLASTVEISSETSLNGNVVQRTHYGMVRLVGPPIPIYHNDHTPAIDHTLIEVVDGGYAPILWTVTDDSIQSGALAIGDQDIRPGMWATRVEPM